MEYRIEYKIHRNRITPWQFRHVIVIDYKKLRDSHNPPPFPVVFVPYSYSYLDILCDLWYAPLQNVKCSVAVYKTRRNGLSTWPWCFTKCFVTDCSRDLGCFMLIPQVSCVLQVHSPIICCWRLTITWLMFSIDHSRDRQNDRQNY